MRNFFKLAFAIAISEFAGVIGATFTTPTIRSGWYATLVKPGLNPPSWIFGPVWTTLFILMGISLYLAWKNNWNIARSLKTKNRRAWNPWSKRLWSGDLQTVNVIAIFALQYGLNILWSVVFFGLQRPDIAFFVLVALWFAILFTIINFYRISRPAAWLLIPYFLWVTFAGYLNYSIWILN